MSLYNYLFVFSYVSVGSVLIPIVSYFFARRKDKTLRTLFFLLLAALISDVSNRAYVLSGMEGYLILNSFYVIQFTLLCVIYSLLLIEEKWVFLLLTLFLIVFISYTIFFQSINEYQSFVRTVGAVIMIFLAVKYYVEICQTLPTTNIFRYFPMWINWAVFFYFGFNLLLFIIANYVFKNAPQEISMIFWGFHNLNNIIKNLMFATGIYVCLIKKQDQPTA